MAHLRGKPKLLDKDGVNPYDAPKGFRAQLSNPLACTSRNNLCHFAGLCVLTRMFNCLAIQRGDKKDVIFIKANQ